MRAYVITDNLDTGLPDPLSNTVGVTSSKSTAIKAVEDFLQRNGDVFDAFEWESKGKHAGHATQGDHTVSYQMFFINRIEE